MNETNEFINLLMANEEKTTQRFAGLLNVILCDNKEDKIEAINANIDQEIRQKLNEMGRHEINANKIIRCK